METTSTLDHNTRTTPVLTAADRCDLCGARAWVRATMKNGSLLFCAHHVRGHVDALREKAIELIDERYILFSEEGSVTPLM
ncbi:MULTISPECIES: DUF7455 domain-containing protein [unclassified Schaalia]|uniref:DUF7455 domain-containing protein n=1 Tax=unclassified Schaalia TaxID=2691889 RepID=UPI001E52B8C9|nr:MULTISPECIES: hypothetical protein [unclassified Schaalia]MCD4549490.1 hypothetical protein [Schaalia sp. lx-260]MCD4558051.1 hypothetical protein [Schaalia sp. lx-100]